MEDEQKQTGSEKTLVRTCLLEIFKRNGYADNALLTHRAFEHISHEIEVKTATLISVSTLKRLLNGEFSRMPQIATLNAISNYLGFKNWQEYKISFLKDTVPDDVSVDTPTVLKQAAIGSRSRQFSKRFKLVTITSFSLLCASIVFLFIQYSSRSVKGDVASATFSAEKTTSNEIPNTVIFKYNIDNVMADSFFIQQSWDKNRRVRIYKHNYTLTDIYYEPGYHIAKLIANDSVIRTVDISIPTDRWFLFAKDTSPNAVPQYIKPTTEIIHDGHLKLRTTDLVSHHIDIKEEKAFVYSYFPSDIKVNSDNFVLKTRVRVDEVRNNLCPNIVIEVTAQQSFMFLMTGSKGCANKSIVLFGENFLDGKNIDLSSLGYDVTGWMNVEMRVKERKVDILFNEKPVFSTSYKLPTGLITGVVVASNGLPEVDFIDLKGLDGTVVYHNDFSFKESAPLQ